MVRLIGATGPIGLVLFGLAAALIIGYLCGARRYWLIAVALMSIPLTFVGILIHDVMDLDIGLSPLASTLVVVCTTTGCGAGLTAALFANKPG